MCLLTYHGISLTLLVYSNVAHSTSRTSAGQPHVHEINEALHRLNIRMQQAARDESARRSAEAQRKRVLTATGEERGDSKRVKMDVGPSSSTPSGIPSAPPNLLANFDYGELPVSLVTELVIENLRHFSPEFITAAIAVCFLFIGCCTLIHLRIDISRSSS